MRIVSWNVNSVRIRYEQILELIDHYDVVCLQEVKTTEFPEFIGCNVICNLQKAYNGVAIITKNILHNITNGIPFYDDKNARVISCNIGDIFLINVYCPNGTGLEHDNYQYKLEFFDALRRFAKDVLLIGKRVIICGDFNVAPRNIDLNVQTDIMCSPKERTAWYNLTSLGFFDVLEDDGFTWWDYRNNAFASGKGARIDHFLVSSALYDQGVVGGVLKDYRSNARPSDHAPIMISL